jgi:hypothetical protein
MTIMHNKTVLRLIAYLLPLLLWFNLAQAGATATPAAPTLDIGLDGLNPPPPPPKKKPEPPKKTEYDKLPYAEVLAKAESDDFLAQFELGSRFNYGRGTPKDTAKALQWLRKAAKAGQQDAQRLLAVKFANGFDVKPDYAEAMKWTEKLAEQHDVAAQVMMGNLYANGDTKGGKRNLPRAYAWYSIAASNQAADENSPAADEKAQEQQAKNEEMIPVAVQEREKLAELISAKEQAQAQKFASNWWAKHPPPVKPKEMSEEEMAKMGKEPNKAVPAK